MADQEIGGHWLARSERLTAERDRLSDAVEHHECDDQRISDCMVGKAPRPSFSEDKRAVGGLSKK